MNVTYIRWRDALHSMEDTHIDEIDLVDLQEIGFLVSENEEFVTLAMEHPEETQRVRLWLCIPKVNIRERYDIDLSKLTKPKKVRKPRKKVSPASTQASSAPSDPEPNPPSAT